MRKDAESPAIPERSFLGIRRSDQFVVGFFVITSFVLMAVHWAQLSGWGLQPVEIERQHALPLDYRIDVNMAAWVEWIQLPGIGEVLARRIVDDREMHGAFKSVDDLQRVKGIGPKRSRNFGRGCMLSREFKADENEKLLSSGMRRRLRVS